ncbi:MAG: 4-methyl-5(B-hydroxyethyl)-thiazole monophosphate biosynthesis protein [Candidatus Muproteobacteria bacterium RBG_16_62_13]|uniref:4-methyl-5(B-hydroxyethyl)-thiazole monophosphate biosynthesis protein n=1 Tax=Candidatus Muproteobacteria bacterium RBG_16_62_13 TaxID=1817756 RepID=A0A1F6SZD2_9PROT|nr:MAG: 4-methyl-5(B-hydroxyethyl)-thiazole monophosphate biosynthesis protein [Candidatus Muproteobacteria bacterium RBG_16_62_13]
MATVLVPLAPGFEDLEAVTITDLLRRAQIEVVTAGLTTGPIRGSRGTTVVPDTTLDDALQRNFDMVVLPGGQPGATNLEQDARVRTLLQKMAQQGHYTAAICAAPKVLAAAGLLDGKHATGFPGSLDTKQFPKIRIEDQDVVTDGKIITSRGPGTAMDFTLTLIELLAGKEKRNQVEASLHRPASHLRREH